MVVHYLRSYYGLPRVSPSLKPAPGIVLSPAGSYTRARSRSPRQTSIAPLKYGRSPSEPVNVEYSPQESASSQPSGSPCAMCDGGSCCEVAMRFLGP